MDDARQTALRLLLSRLSAHSEICAEQRDAILALPATMMAVRAYLDFVRAGERLEYSCLILDGLVARYEQFDDGRRQTYSLHIPGDFVDLNSLLLPGAPTALQAVCASRIAKVPHRAIREAIERTPGLSAIFWRDTVVEAAMLGQSLARIGRRDAYARTAHLLCEMSVRYGRVDQFDRIAFRFPITQEHLGDVLGLTSVHVNRTLKALREDELVEIGSGRVKILDQAALRRAAEFDPSYLGSRDDRTRIAAA